MKTKLLSILFFALGAGNMFAQPANDICSGAISLTPHTSCIYTPSNTFNATQSLPAINCTGTGTYPNVLDVWFKFVATSTTHSITVNKTDINILDDPCIDLRSGACNGISIACAGDGTIPTPVITKSGLTIGATYYIRVYYFSSQTGGTFDICVRESCTLSGITPAISSPGTGSSPGQTVNTTTPTLSWNTVSGAAMYGVYVRDMISNTLIYNNDCATSSTSYTLPAGILSNGGQYRWNIIAYSSCNSTCTSNAAAPLYFQVQTSSCTLTGANPAIVSPGSITSPGPVLSTTTPTFSWNAVSGAINYGVYVRDLTTNTLVINNDCATAGTTYTVPSGILTNGNQFRWNIQANSNCNLSCVSNYSPVLYFQINTTVGTAEFSFENSFSIYPNPSNGTFTIETGEKEKEYEIIITDILGKRIFSQKSLNEKSEIDLGDQPSGIYFILITSKKGTAIQKLIISH